MCVGRFGKIPLTKLYHPKPPMDHSFWGVKFQTINPAQVSLPVTCLSLRFAVLTTRVVVNLRAKGRGQRVNGKKLSEPLEISEQQQQQQQQQQQHLLLTHVHMYIHIHMLYLHIYTHTHTYRHKHKHTQTYICTCTYTRIHRTTERLKQFLQCSICWKKCIANTLLNFYNQHGELHLHHQPFGRGCRP